MFKSRQKVLGPFVRLGVFIIKGTMKKISQLLIFLLIFSCDSPKKEAYIIDPQNNVVTNYTQSDEVEKIVFFSLDKLKIPNVKISIVYIPNFIVTLHEKETNSYLEGFIVETSLNTYQILVNRNLNEINLRRVLFHEMIHLKQSHTGRLINCNRMSSQFDGVDYPNIDEVPYLMRPWEYEAFKHQKNLILYYNMYE